MLRIGIDVGGTNTDAVLLDGLRVLSWTKSSTTADVMSGIATALRELLSQARVSADRIGAVMIGTTHFTNAVIERRRLLRCAAIRVGLPATASVRPFAGWPDDLREALGGVSYLVRGGNEYDGRNITSLDEAAIRTAARDIRRMGIGAVAVTSVFSPVTSAMEERAAEIIASENPDAAISLSHRIGKVGLIERENATILNACLAGLAVSVSRAFRDALTDLGISAPFFISQNDGTLMTADFVERYPVLTFASGPTNSMRGAAFLSGMKESIVIDIGGTTSDLGVLVGGFPRDATTVVDIGGVRTNFRMPDVLAIGLGGGSIVRSEGDRILVGPQSVGYELASKALVFGGDVCTATDVAVALGLADIGDRSKARALPAAFLRSALKEIHRKLNEAIDRMKVSSGDVPIILVGGGSILVSEKLEGASETIRPNHGSVANAIGAAIAQVGGMTDRIFMLDRMSRSEALEQAKREATERAYDAGARKGSVEIVDIDEVPLAYLPGNATRIRVNAVGDLSL